MQAHFIGHACVVHVDDSCSEDCSGRQPRRRSIKCSSFTEDLRKARLQILRVWPDFRYHPVWEVVQCSGTTWLSRTAPGHACLFHCPLFFCYSFRLLWVYEVILYAFPSRLGAGSGCYGHCVYFFRSKESNFLRSLHRSVPIRHYVMPISAIGSYDSTIGCYRSIVWILICFTLIPHLASHVWLGFLLIYIYKPLIPPIKSLLLFFFLISRSCCPFDNFSLVSLVFLARPCLTTSGPPIRLH
jgi:hypothetical protein